MLDFYFLLFRLFKLAQDRQFTPFNVRQGEEEFGVNSLNSETLASRCPYTNSRKPNCIRNDKFRTVDGSCNNLVIRYKVESQLYLKPCLPPG